MDIHADHPFENTLFLLHIHTNRFPLTPNIDEATIYH